MREITPAEQIRDLREYLDAGVFDAMIKKCQSETRICAVHERLKNAYSERVVALKEAVAGGNLARIHVLGEEIEEIGDWVFDSNFRTTNNKEALTGQLLDLTNLSWTQAERVRHEATQGHQGPDFSTAMSREQMLLAFQMYEDGGAKWQQIADKFEPSNSPSSNLDRLRHRLDPLRSVVRKYCPLPS